MDSVLIRNLADQGLKKPLVQHLEKGPHAEALNKAMGEELADRISSALAAADKPLAPTAVKKLAGADLASDRKLSLREFARKNLARGPEQSPELPEKLEQGVELLSDSTTVADLLGLERPLAEISTLRREVAATRLRETVATTPGIKAGGDLPEKFAAAWGTLDLSSSGDPWEKLERKESLSGRSNELKAIKLTLELDNLVAGNDELLEALQEIRGRGEFESLDQLAIWDVAKWRSIGASREAAEQLTARLAVRFPTAGAPPVAKHQPEIDLRLVRKAVKANPSLAPGEPAPRGVRLSGLTRAEERNARAALDSLSRESAAFPGLDAAKLIGGAKSKFENPVRAQVDRFWENASDLDLLNQDLDSYVKQNPSALKGIRDKEPVIGFMKTRQRMLRVAPSLEAADRLVTVGFNSAMDVASMSMQSFAERTADVLGGVQKAEMAYSKAVGVAERSLAVAGAVRQSMFEVLPHVIGKVDAKQLPDWAELFGSADYCECEHCRSVYSPAAYLVDLLQFLHPKIPPATGAVPIDVLLERRPDLAQIKLSCENTNTAIPYVDLANEVMESYIAFNHPIAHDTSTEATVQELAANPVYVEENAYDTLAGAVYPFSLPFDRSVEVARIFLQQLGTSRAEVLETLGPPGDARDRSASSERLGFTPTEFRIVTGTNFDGTAVPTPSTASLYGFTGTQATGAGWRTTVGAVEEFLTRTGLDPQELTALVLTRYVGGGLTPPAPKLIVINDESGTCDTSKMQIRHLDETALTDGELRRMQEFIRLWRKLGWKMEQVDAALSAFSPGSAIGGDALLRLGEAIALKSRLKLDLNVLVAIWGPIDTHGKKSLYEKLFRSRAVRQLIEGDFDPFELKADRSELKIASTSSPPQPATIEAHASAIAAALRLSGEDLAALANRDASNGKLNLANLSALHRGAALARALRVSIPDFLLLRTLSGTDPYAEPASTAEFVQAVQAAKRCGVSLSRLDYLLRNATGGTAGPSPDPAKVGGTATAIRSGLARIEADTAVQPDPSGSITRAKLATILAPEALEAVTGALAGTAEYRSTLGSLPAAVSFPDALARRVRYDDTSHELVFAGAMTPAERTQLLSLSGGSAYQAAVQALFDRPRELLAQHCSVFLDPAAAPASLFDGGLVAEQRYAYVLERLMPHLRGALSRELITQTLAGALSLEPSSVEALLTKILHSLVDSGRPMMDDFLELAQAGLSGRYFSTPDLTGSSNLRLDPGIDFDWTGSSSPAPGSGSFSVRWEGMLLAPASDEFTFTLTVAGGAQLAIDDQPLIDHPAQQQPAGELTGTITLKANQLYRIRLDYFHTSGDARVKLTWGTPTRRAEKVPASAMFGGTVSECHAAVDRVQVLAESCKLNADELLHIAAHPADFGGLDLNALPKTPGDYLPAGFSRWLAVQQLAALRSDLADLPIVPVDLLSAPTEEVAAQRLADAAGWELDAVQSVATRLDISSADWRNSAEILALRRGMKLADRVAAPLAQLLVWAVEQPNPAIAQAIKDAAKAAWDHDTWLQVAPPLMDELRSKQRDALIAYLLPRTGLETADRLFEHFLIDVEMDPCMKTSRIKQAISSVQLFVQRCLMNLEKKVSPSSIDGEQWRTWMCRYRVWEANRKVFLYPENWIEPELRDDKTPFFKDLESALLQGDVTAEAVEDALLSYLEKLDDVSRLQICAAHWQREAAESAAKPAIDVLHVFGRTSGTAPTYHYRQFRDGKVWTPWRKVSLDIASDHLIPVIHNRRLFLFWATFALTGDPKDNLPASDSPSAPSQHWEIRLSWSEFWRGKWSPKQTTRTALQSWDFLGPEEHFFQARHEADDLVIYCHNGRRIGTGAIGEFRFKGCKGDGAVTDCRNPNVGFQHFHISPTETWPAYQFFRETEHPGFLEFVTGDWENQDAPGPQGEYWNAEKEEVRALDYVPEPYDILYPDQYAQYALQAPCFFQDVHRAYFIEPFRRRTSVIIPSPGKDPHLRFPPELNWEEEVDLPKPGEPIDLGIGPRVVGPINPLLDPSRFEPVVRTDGVATPASGGLPGQPAEVFTTQPAALAAPFAGGVRGPSMRPLTLTSASLRASDAPGLVAPQSLLRAGAFGDGNSVSGAQEPAVDAVATEMAMKASADVWNPTPTGWATVRDADYPAIFHYAEAAASLALDPEKLGGLTGILGYQQKWGLRFHSHWHPHICQLIRTLNRGGIPGLLGTDSQRPTDDANRFKDYQPTPRVASPYPEEKVDFDFGSAYGTYNWEVFFHVPVLLASRLSKAQRFEEAQRWFHYIFDPTSSTDEPDPDRFWNFLPFKGQPQERIADLMVDLSYSGSDASQLKRREELEAQVEEWRKHPFSPHLIARMRTTAYQKNVVMRYIDNLIEWGDMLFRQNTIETINEASQLYVLAGEILGRRPNPVRPSASSEPMTYAQLLPGLDSFSNALITLENQLPFASGAPSGAGGGASGFGSLGFSQALYFCIPNNQKLVGYWDTVADRLYKIRHCMNIEGVEQELPLFEPPIDPGALVAAAAGGGGALAAALGDLNAPLPQYRFSILLQKALELCAEVKSLGNALLGVLEKQDAEALAALRSQHEAALLKANLEVRKREVDEAQTNLDALKASQTIAEKRRDFYAGLISKKLIANEETQMSELAQAHDWQGWAQGADIAASVAYAIPDIIIGVAGWASSPVAKAQIGGSAFGHALSAASKSFGFLGSLNTYAANRASQLGQWARRAEEWEFQRATADREASHIAKQVEASLIRLELSNKAVDNLQTQIDQATEVSEFLRDKYTNAELYGWMTGQVSAVYFQTYQLAFDLAKRAERAFRFERGLETTSYIQFGYWDNLKKGLLAGERLSLDLKRLENAALDQNKREYELVKNVSLAQANPLALLSLKATGVCEVDLPEGMFDADYPGHYMRRFKSVSLSIPCVVGPYTSVNCTLTLLKSKTRINSIAQGDYPENTEEEDPRFRASFAAVQSIATSSAHNDSGVFELSFRDERYLPFEGAGAISTWRIELPTDTNAFDFETIADVVIKCNYTAREGGVALREAARAATIAPAQEGVTRAFSLRQEFSTEWARFLSPPDEQSGEAMSFDLTKARFPFRFRGREIEITAVEAFLLVADGVSYPNAANSQLKASLAPANASSAPTASFTPMQLMGGLPRAKFDFESSPQGLGGWKLAFSNADIQKLPAAFRTSVTDDGTVNHRLKPDAIDDVIMLVTYSAS